MGCLVSALGSCQGPGWPVLARVPGVPFSPLPVAGGLPQVYRASGTRTPACGLELPVGEVDGETHWHRDPGADLGELEGRGGGRSSTLGWPGSEAGGAEFPQFTRD